MAISAMPNLTSSDGTTAQAAVGTIFEAGGNAWVYCKATAAAIAAYSVCSGANYGVMEAATTTTAAALGTAGGCACIPQFDVGASEYFYALVGPFNVNPVDDTTTFKILSANTTAGNLLYSTATAGVVDDASTTALVGVTITSTSTTQAATPCTAWRRIGWVR